MDGNPLGALWDARSVAIVGASDRAGALGRLPVEFLLRYGFDGQVLPVRPDGDAVCGVPSYPSVADCPRPVDVAMIMVAAERVPEALRECATAGVGMAIVCTSGFAETGGAGSALQEEAVAIARQSGMRLLGPNCIGTVGALTGQVTSFSPLFSAPTTKLVPGSLGFVSQSGALGYGAVSLAFERGLGLGWIANTGNEADVTAAEVMAELSSRPDCTGILAYVENLTDLPQLLQVARSGKPVAILKAGRSAAGARAAASHTGSLATEDRVVDAALSQLGFVRAADIEELLDIGSVMSLPRPSGSQVAIVTTSGGSGILAADAIDAEGLQLAELLPETTTALDAIVPAYGSTANPVDVTATVMSDSTLFDRALDLLVDDPHVDSIVACFCVLTGRDVDDVIASLARAAARSNKPLLAVRTGANHLAPDAADRLLKAGIPSFSTPERAIKALSALVRFSLSPTFPSAPEPLSGPIPSPGASEPELKALLASHGLSVPMGRAVTSGSDTLSAVAESGGAVVLKAVLPGLVHKSEAGGVLLNVTAANAEESFAAISALGGEVWAEEQVPPGVEALVGFTSSPLGLVLTVGVGGVLTELVADVSVRLLPVTRDDISVMVDETRLGTLLAGVRGSPPADRQSLIDCVMSLCTLVMGWPAGFELDINPLTVLSHGVRILDAAYVDPTDVAIGAH